MGQQIPQKDLVAAAEVAEKHKLELKHWNAFETFAMTAGNMAKAAEAAGVSIGTVWNWRRSAWWKDMKDAVLVKAQEGLHLGLAALAPQVVESMRKILTDDPTIDPKNSNAKVQILGRLMEAGADPIIARRGPAVQVNQQFNSYGPGGQIGGALIERLRAGGSEAETMRKAFEIESDKGPVEAWAESYAAGRGASIGDVLHGLATGQIPYPEELRNKGTEDVADPMGDPAIGGALNDSDAVDGEFQPVEAKAPGRGASRKPTASRAKAPRPPAESKPGPVVDGMPDF